jgi:hypothetical protein
MQLDVTAMPSGAAVVYGTTYLLPDGSAPRSGGTFTLIGHAGNAGGLWVDPAKLKGAKERNTATGKLFHMSYTIGGHARPAVWMQMASEKGYTCYVYDEATGILLHDGMASEGKSPEAIGENEAANTANLTLADCTLVSQRVIAYPWTSGAEWSAPTSALSFSGSTVVPAAGGMKVNLGQEFAMTPEGNGDGWVRYSTTLTTTNSMGAPPTSATSDVVSGLGQFGGVWLPPAALARLTKDQVLDTDTLTGTTVSVAAVSAREVIIRARSAAESFLWGYDLQSGQLNIIAKREPSPYGPMDTKLTLARG